MPQLVTPGGSRGGGSRVSQMPQAQVLDVGKEPQLKNALLSGRLQNLTAPFLYHDPAKKLALVLMPMEMGMADLDQQRIIGQMTQNVMRGLPENTPLGYLLQPRTFFTFQSLIEAIFEADGVTPEMLKDQQSKADLLRDMLRATSIDSLRELARANDAKVDAQLFDLLTASAEANSTGGREQVMQALLGVQSILLEETTFGKKIAARMDVIEAFQKTPTREVLLDQLIASPDFEAKETLVAMGRQLLDYAFFQQLTGKIDAASDPAAKDKLIALRKEIQDTRDKVDAASREIMSGKVQFIQDILASKDPLTTAREREAEIDDTFFGVIQANLEQATQRNDEQSMQALQAVYNIGMQIMNERQPPEVQLINALMQAKFPEETEKMLHELKDATDDRLLTVMAQFAEQLAQNDRTEASARLTQIMLQARGILPKYDPATDPDQQPPQAGGGSVSSSGLIGGNNPPPSNPPPKIEIARR